MGGGAAVRRTLGSGWEVATVDVLAVLGGAGVLVVVGLLLRRRVLTRQGGTFDCSLRVKPGRQGQGWTLGIGRYAGDSLEWYRVFSFGLRPREVFGRRDLEIVERRAPTGPEAFAVSAAAVVVRCRRDGGFLELALSPDALTGFLSWVESAPPGRHA